MIDTVVFPVMLFVVFLLGAAIAWGVADVATVLRQIRDVLYEIKLEIIRSRR